MVSKRRSGIKQGIGESREIEREKVEQSDSRERKREEIYRQKEKRADRDTARR